MGTAPTRAEVRKTFFASLGECITAWASVERAIFDLFHRALDADRDKCALIFWSIPNFGMRLSYTSMIVAHCLVTRDNKETRAQRAWKDLNKDLNNHHSFRNNLAHQPKSEDKIFLNEDTKEVDMIIWAEEMIVPNSLDRRQKFKPIEQSDLESHLRAVLLIEERLKTFTIYFPSLAESASLTFSEIE
jgi:hypothetical protein